MWTQWLHAFLQKGVDLYFLHALLQYAKTGLYCLHHDADANDILENKVRILNPFKTSFLFLNFEARFL